MEKSPQETLVLCTTTWHFCVGIHKVKGCENIGPTKNSCLKVRAGSLHLQCKEMNSLSRRLLGDSKNVRDSAVPLSEHSRALVICWSSQTNYPKELHTTPVQNHNYYLKII